MVNTFLEDFDALFSIQKYAKQVLCRFRGMTKNFKMAAARNE